MEGEMNKLVYFNEKNEQIVFRENVAEEDINKFLAAKDNFVQVMNSIDYYNIVKDNIVELMQAIINYDFRQEKAFATINRYFFNMVSSFYCYVKYYERFFHDRYKRVFSEQFDKYDTYKIISELRKYTTHCFMAITQSSFDIMTGKYSIQIIPNDLLEKDKGMLRKDVKDILKRQIDKGEVIDLRLLTGDFLNIFCELQIKIMNEMKEDIFEDLKTIEDFIYGKNLNKKESYILKEDGAVINTSNILFLFLKKFQEEYTASNAVEILKEMHEG